MANDKESTVVEKRTRFFDGQFLQDEDFNVEQAYHLDRHRRHNRLLHLPGVAEGLAVTASGRNTVTVGPGTAIDDDGRLLVLAESATLDLPGPRFNDKQGIDLYVSYAESAEDRQTGEGSDDFRRWLERPQLTAVLPGEAYGRETLPVLLAKLSLDGEGRVSVDQDVRSYSGVRLPGPAADPSMLRTGRTGDLMLTGGLTVTDKLRLNGNQQLVFGDIDTSNNLRVQLWTGYGLGINPGTLFYAANGKHSWRDNSGENERMALTTGPDGGLTVSGTGTSSFGGPLEVGGRLTVSGGLTVSGTGTSSFAGPLELRRDAGASRGSAWFLELFQDESSPAGADVHPGIRFRHHRHFETTLEARQLAFHLFADEQRKYYAAVCAGDLLAYSLALGGNGPGSFNPEDRFRRAALDIDAMPPRTGSHPAYVPGLYVTGLLGEAKEGVEFRHNDGTRGIGFGCTSLYAAGSNDSQPLNLMPKGTGGVGIGRTDPQVMLDVNGDCRARNFHQSSDARLKEHLSEISGALDCVGRLRGVRFDWNAAGRRHFTRDIDATTTVGSDATAEENERLREELRQQRYKHLAVRNIGLLAQDVEEVAPELVFTDDDGFKSVDYGRLSAILVEAVKELHAKLAALEGKESGNA